MNWLTHPYRTFGKRLLDLSVSVPVLLAVAPLFAVMAWQYVYLTLAIRRFYFRGDARRVLSSVLAIATAIAIYVLNSLFITVVQTAGAAWALWSL